MAKITYWDGKGLVEEATTESDRRLKKVATAVARQARANCPKKSGRLAGTIRATRSRYAEGGWLVMMGSRVAYYWSFIELGVPEYAPDYKRRAPLRKAFEAVGKQAALGQFAFYDKGRAFFF